MEFTYSDENPARLDVFLAFKMKVSRSQILQLIKSNRVCVNKKEILKSGFILKNGDNIDISALKSELDFKVKKSDIFIEKIYEDDEILILNKPPNLATHGASSLKEESLVEWLLAQNIKLSNLNGEFRAGIVHRLDKQTSGAIIVAKNNEAHRLLSEQLKSREMGRIYLAIIDLPLKDDVEIETYLARNPKNRLKMRAFALDSDFKTARDSMNLDSKSRGARDSMNLDSKKIAKIPPSARYSKSNFYKLLLGNDLKKELILAQLSTGRTHQIRAHLEFINRHILGDKLYGSAVFAPRVMLHSFIIYFNHAKFGKMAFKADMFSDMLACLKENFNMEKVYETTQNVANRYIF